MELIKSQMPAADIQVMIEDLQRLNVSMEMYFVNLSDDERTGLRSMAEGREGYVRLINEIAMANPDALRRKDDPKMLDEKLSYDKALEGVRQLLLSLYEKVEETHLANSKDIMKVADSFANALQNSRGRNSALDKSMNEV